MVDHLTETVEVVRASEYDELVKAVKSLISDIESMQERPQTYPDQFGPFSTYQDDEDDGATIEWPNLAISLAEVKKLLEPKTIEGELTKTQIAMMAAAEKGPLIVNHPLARPNVDDLKGLPKIKD